MSMTAEPIDATDRYVGDRLSELRREMGLNLSELARTSAIRLRSCRPSRRAGGRSTAPPSGVFAAPSTPTWKTSFRPATSRSAVAPEGVGQVLMEQGDDGG
jgi:hypothetical protein